MKGTISIVFILMLFLSACGSIGTETGNPQMDPFMQGNAHNITYEMPTDWIQENNDQVAASTDNNGGETQESSERVVDMFILGGLDSSVESTVTIYVILLNQIPNSLEEYLVGERPTVTFETYENDNLSGFIYDDPNPGSNGGDLKEIYFLKDNTLLYIVAELFEGSGSTEAEVILSSINFAE